MLNANTLSRDGMGALNSALREIVHTDNWNRQEHVQWLVQIAFKILNSIEQDEDHQELIKELKQ